MYMYVKPFLLITLSSILAQSPFLQGAAIGAKSPLSVIIEEHEGAKASSDNTVSALESTSKHQHSHAHSSGPVLTLDAQAAVRYALEKNKGLQAARLKIEQARARHSQAGKWHNPSVGLSYSSDHFGNDESEATLRLEFSQRFPVTDRLAISKNIQAIEIELAQAEVQNQERLLIAKIEAAFVDIALYNALIELRQALIQLTRDHVNFVQSRVQSGEINPIEINQLQLDLFTLQQEQSALLIEKEEVIDHLKPILTLAHDKAVNMVSELKSLESLNSTLNGTVFNIESHPQYLIADLLQQIAAQETDLAFKQKWEDITLKLFVDNERSVDAPRGVDSNQFVGIGVSVPLPLWNQHEGTVKEKRLQRQKIQLKKEALVLELKHENYAIREYARNLMRQCTYFEEKIAPLAKQNAKETEEAYTRGQATIETVFKAQKTQLTLTSENIKTRAKAQHALIDWLTNNGAISKNYRN